MQRNYLEKLHQNESVSLKRDAQMTSILSISKTYQKEMSKQARFFDFQKHTKMSSWKLHQFTSMEITSKKYIETTSIF